MSGRQLGKNVSLQVAQALTTNGTSEVVSAAVDMQGYTGCIFIGEVATGAADNIAFISQCATSGGTYVDLAGTACTVATGANADIFMIDVYRPTKRFLKCNVERGTSTVLGNIVAIKYGGPRKGPSTHTADVGASGTPTFAVSPVESAGNSGA